MQIDVEVEEVVMETVMKEMPREVYEDISTPQVVVIHGYWTKDTGFFVGEYLILIECRRDGWSYVR